jgi:hypothetical protein
MLDLIFQIPTQATITLDCSLIDEDSAKTLRQTLRILRNRVNDVPESSRDVFQRFIMFSYLILGHYERIPLSFKKLKPVEEFSQLEEIKKHLIEHFDRYDNLKDVKGKLEEIVQCLTGLFVEGEANKLLDEVIRLISVNHDDYKSIQVLVERNRNIDSQTVLDELTSRTHHLKIKKTAVAVCTPHEQKKNLARIPAGLHSEAETPPKTLLIIVGIAQRESDEFKSIYRPLLYSMQGEATIHTVNYRHHGSPLKRLKDLIELKLTDRKNQAQKKLCVSWMPKVILAEKEETRSQSTPDDLLDTEIRTDEEIETSTSYREWAEELARSRDDDDDGDDDDDELRDARMLIVGNCIGLIPVTGGSDLNYLEEENGNLTLQKGHWTDVEVGTMLVVLPKSTVNMRHDWILANQEDQGLIKLASRIQAKNVQEVLAKQKDWKTVFAQATKTSIENVQDAMMAHLIKSNYQVNKKSTMPTLDLINYWTDELRNIGPGNKQMFAAVCAACGLVDKASEYWDVVRTIRSMRNVAGRYFRNKLRNDFKKALTADFWQIIKDTDYYQYDLLGFPVLLCRIDHKSKHQFQVNTRRLNQILETPIAREIYCSELEY